MWITMTFILVIGLFSQYIDGTLGMGYGATASSILIATGLLPALVSASVHTAEIFASFASSVSHVRMKNVKKEISLPLIISGIIGGVIGALFLVNINEIIVKISVGGVLLFLGIFIFYRFALRKSVTYSKALFSKPKLFLLGLIGATFDAFGGGGWGPICTSTLVSQNKQEPRYIIGSVNFAEFFATVAMVITFGLTLGFENFLWLITIPLIIGGVIAAPLAAFTCHRVPSRWLGVSIGVFLVILNVRTLLKALGFPIL